MGSHLDPLKGTRREVGISVEKDIQKEVGSTVCGVGPAHCQRRESACSFDFGGCVEKEGCANEKCVVDGPLVLRTRVGDLLIDGPNISSPEASFQLVKPLEVEEVGNQPKVVGSLVSSQDPQLLVRTVSSQQGKGKGEPVFHFRARGRPK
ncbi:hypothetical protein A2U01_0043108, partial [Trifolium medium]|nr:hypothetical protein [Trifolium medium]